MPSAGLVDGNRHDGFEIGTFGFGERAICRCGALAIRLIETERLDRIRVDLTRNGEALICLETP